MYIKKIGVFVDLVSQFNNVDGFYPGEKINYDAYLSRIDEIGSIYKSIAYGASVGDEANKFIKCMTDKGFDVKYVEARKSKGKSVIKYTDRTMDMVVDIIKMIDRIDIVVIGSSNLNLAPFLIYLKEKGITVIVFSCGIPKVLKYNCSEWWEVTDKYFESKHYSNVKVETIK